MNKKLIFLFFGAILFLYVTSNAQIIIDQNELPAGLETVWTTINDTTGSVILDVGVAGEDQRWEFMEEIEGLEIKHTVVPLNSTPFQSDFPNSNYIIKYEGGLLDVIYSDIFPEIEGDVYFYQQITDTAVCLLGSGFCSDFATGAAIFEPPNVILNFLPTQYGDVWISRSKFSISKDTTILGVEGEFKLTVDDSAYSIIDGWGKISIPMGEFECLRMKSYVTMHETVSFNDMTIVEKHSCIINYNWITEDYGLLMRVASHTGEQNDNFIDARLYARMTSFQEGPSKVSGHFNFPPNDFILLQNYPNPFNLSTTITYKVPEPGKVRLKIYNLPGEEIYSAVNVFDKGGIHQAIWDGRNGYGNILPSGIYFYQVEFSGITKIYNIHNKMILLK